MTVTLHRPGDRRDVKPGVHERGMHAASAVRVTDGALNRESITLHRLGDRPTHFIADGEDSFLEKLLFVDIKGQPFFVGMARSPGGEGT